MRDVEGIDGGLVVIGAVVLVLGADALVEEGGVPGAALVGEADGLDVGGSLCDPEAAGGVDGDGGRGGGAAGGAGGAADGLRAGVDGVVVAGVEVSAEAVTEVDVALAFNALSDRGRLSVEDGLAGGGVRCGGVAVVEVDVEVVGVEGDVLEDDHRAGLVGGVHLLLGERANTEERSVGGLFVVENS